jgi:hypothetical protein
MVLEFVYLCPALRLWCNTVRRRPLDREELTTKEGEPVMSKPPVWPFKCPRGHGWYLSNVKVIFPEDCNLENCGCDPATPLLVYGDCKEHGRVWIGDTASYDPQLWRKEYELRQVEWAERTTSV